MEVLGTADGWHLEARCTDHSCLPVMVPTRPGLGEQALPTVTQDPPWSVDGVALKALLLVDLDGDTKPELRVDWRSVGVPRAAVGSWHRDFTTVLDPSTGALRLNVETGSFGGASEVHCAGTLVFDATGATLERQCQLNACRVGGAMPGECEEGPTEETRRLVWLR